jgi:hypothetical protein
MATKSRSGYRSPRRAAHGLAALLVAGAFVTGLAGGCRSTAATPTPSEEATASATLEVSASIVSAEPTRTKFAPTPEPTVEPTPTPEPTPVPLPNLTGNTPTLDPDPPTCNVDFVLDVLVRNTGRGPTLGEALVVAGATRDSDSRIDLKTPMPNVPPLAAGASIHLIKTVSITGGGPHTLTIFIDSSLWVTETNEGDNNISRTVNVKYGSCPK